jgi:hypothetical protein
MNLPKCKPALPLAPLTQQDAQALESLFAGVDSDQLGLLAALEISQFISLLGSAEEVSWMIGSSFSTAGLTERVEIG